MTPGEFREVAKRIIAKWSHQPPPREALAESFEAVKDLDFDSVMVAVESFYRSGREWPPNGGMLRERVMELALDAPDWGEAWRWIGTYVDTGTCNPAYGHFDAYRRRGEQLLERMPAPVAAFIRALGARQLYEASEGQGGGEARLREKWQSWSRRQSREAALFGLPSGSLPALERINRAAPVALETVLRQALPAGDGGVP